MSTKDKTREKLLNSMRKTKDVIDEQPDTPQAHAGTYATSADKTVKSGKSGKSGKKTTPAKVGQDGASRPGLATDPYRSRGRVWPD